MCTSRNILWLVMWVSFSGLLISCGSDNDKDAKSLVLVWQDGRAVALSIPKGMLEGIPRDSLQSNVAVMLANHGDQPFMAGELVPGKGNYLFNPLIPFTRGLRYAVYIKHKLITEIEIPKGTMPPELSGIFPSVNTVPENLLKFYLVFSKPMVTGSALKFITLIDEKGDSLPKTFLDLQHELWNKDATMLTIWFDPGRVKRDLQPNQLLGRPLQAGKSYQLIISSSWPDREGNVLGKTITKKFRVQGADLTAPSPSKWSIRAPAGQSRKPLVIDFGEPLDFAMQQTAFRIVDAGGNIVDGSIRILAQEIAISFVPVKPWEPGQYRLLVEGRLEDLAGNSINRLFELDLSSKAKESSPRKVFEKRFTVSR